MGDDGDDDDDGGDDGGGGGGGGGGRYPPHPNSYLKKYANIFVLYFFGFVR